MEKAVSNGDKFVEHIQKELTHKNKHNKKSIEKIAFQYSITDQNLIKELTELAIVFAARNIAAKTNISENERYKEIVELYKNQVNLSHRTSRSMMFQQYSTPAPISYIASLYVSNNNALSGYKMFKNCALSDKAFKEQYGIEVRSADNLPQLRKVSDPIYFEPSAGNGLLTIALPYAKTIVNELDEIRLANLKKQPFSAVLNQDATNPFPEYYKYFRGVVTNPPFGSLADPVEYDGYKFKTLDHLMTLRALDTMEDDGKAAIIIGGHTAWDDVGRTQAGKNRIFLNYLYSHYNIEDIISIDGHKLYSRQGTAFDTRLILINGRKETIEGNAPLINPTLSEVVKDFDRLWDRVFGNEIDKEKSIKIAKAKMLMLKLKDFSLDGYVQTEVLSVKNKYKNKNINTIRKEVDNYYKENLSRKKIINIDKKVVIFFGNVGRKKSIYGRKDKFGKIIKIDSIIATAIHHLIHLLEFATFENYGYNLKPNHIKIKGKRFWNFRAKLIVDNKLYNFIIPVLEIEKKDALQYSIEYAQIKKSLVGLKAKSVKQRPKYKRF